MPASPFALICVVLLHDGSGPRVEHEFACSNQLEREEPPFCKSKKFAQRISANKKNVFIPLRKRVSRTPARPASERASKRRHAPSVKLANFFQETHRQATRRLRALLQVSPRRTRRGGTHPDLGKGRQAAPRLRVSVGRKSSTQRCGRSLPPPMRRRLSYCTVVF